MTTSMEKELLTRLQDQRNVLAEAVKWHSTDAVEAQLKWLNETIAKLEAEAASG